MKLRARRLLAMMMAIIMLFAFQSSALSTEISAGEVVLTENSETLPAEEPTETPTEEPTEAPTEAPPEEPTEAPTEEPTEAPTEKPTEAPTEAPTEEPTEAPTEEPTEAPTEEPTEAPTEEPAEAPTEEPAEAPTKEPAEAPTDEPTVTPAAESEPVSMFALRAAAVEQEYITVSGNVYWQNANEQTSSKRPASVTVQLMNGDTVVAATTANGPGSTDSSTTSTSFSFENIEKYDADGNVIDYSVQLVSVPDGYMATYSEVSYDITLGFTYDETTNHTFGHIDVRIDEGASLQMKIVVKDENGNVLDTSYETIPVNVSKVHSVTINGTTYNSGFKKDGSYEFRKMSGVSIKLSDLTSSSRAVLVVDLVDDKGVTYEKVTITMGLDGIMDAAYECDGFGNSGWGGPGGGNKTGFDGLDFIIGKVTNYTIDIETYGVAIDVTKLVGYSKDAAVQYSGHAGEFTFELYEEETGRTWTESIDADGKAQFVIYYPSTSMAGKTYSYTLTEKAGSGEFTYDTTAHTFKVKVTVNADGSVITSALDGDSEYTFTNLRKPSFTNVSGSKTWVYGNASETDFVDSITVVLLQNGEEYARQTVTPATDLENLNIWYYVFENVPVADALGNRYTYTVQEIEVPGYETAYSGFDITNTWIEKTTSVSGTKTWDHGDNPNPPESVTVYLYAGNEKVDEKTVTAEDNWQYSFTDLPMYKDGEKITYSVREEELDDYSHIITGYDIYNYYTPEFIDLPVRKTWNDDNDRDGKRPDSITVKLFADNVDTGKTLTLSAEGNWQSVFEDLKNYNDNGEKIAYTIEEVLEGDWTQHYTSEVEGHNIINTHEVSKIAISGEKTWDDDDNRDGIRPEMIVVHLMHGDSIIESAEVTAATGWAWSFDNLYEYADGEKIEYTIVEEPVSGYTPIYDGYNITNQHVPETVDIAGTKSWVGDTADNRPASITVNLFAGSKVIDSKTVTAADGWKYSWTDLPKYENGVEIDYEITENYVQDYITSYHGYDITNRYAPGVRDISVLKEWEDGNNQDGKRPESVTIRLYADGVDTGRKLTLSAANGWAGDFADLPIRASADGEPIVYTISEDVPAGYTAVYADETGVATISVDGRSTDLDRHIVVNVHQPETTTIEGFKTWDDADNQDGVRPAQIVISLYKLTDPDDLTTAVKVTDTLVHPDANGDWKWSFADLPVYEDGVKLTYAFLEDRVPGYSASYNGYEVINTYVPQTISITVNKTWNDDESIWSYIRPETITFNVYRERGETDELVATRNIHITRSDEASYTFTGLPKYDGGGLIEYYVTENPVPGYDTTYGEPVVDADGSITASITNTQQTTGVSVEKVWDDADDQDGLRPDEIIFRLMYDLPENGSEGNIWKTYTLGAANSWKMNIDGLPLYIDGSSVSYYVEELENTGKYTSKVTGENGEWTITNSYKPETIDVEGSKTWNDDNNRDGKRPESITVNLLAGGEKIDSATGTAADDWKWSFTGLPKNAAGVEIDYTITEEAVEDYSTEVIGYDVVNTYTPETVNVNGSKTWNDVENQDGIRPDSITINLLADGEKIDSATVTAADDWKWSFTDLPRYDGGVEIGYAIEEVAVPGYETSISGYNVTNTHKPETVEINGGKTWNDADDQDGKRPDSIVIRVMNGETEAASATVTAESGWKWSFTLPKYAAGEEIEYTIAEDRVNGYSSKVNGYNVTNTYTPETIDISGVKVWNANDFVDMPQPYSVTIRLYADGSEVAYTEVCEPMGWEWNFDDMPKYANGAEIVYTVSEDAVEDFTTAVTGDAETGFTVTNTYDPEVGSLTITKKEAFWVDGVKAQEAPDGRGGLAYRFLVTIGNAEPEEILIKAGESKVYERIPYGTTYSVEEIMPAGAIFESKTENDSGVIAAENTDVNVTNHYYYHIDNAGFNAFKLDSETDEPIEGAGFTLYADAACTAVLAAAVSNEQGKVNLPITGEGTFYLKETTTPAGYHPSGSIYKIEAAIDYEVIRGEDGIPVIHQQMIIRTDDLSTSGAQDGIHFTYVIENTAIEDADVSVQKIWNDGNYLSGRPESIEATLLRDGTVYEKVELNEGNGWYYSWDGLTDEYDWTVDETNVPDDYEKTVVNEGGAWTITNTREVIEIKGMKVWDLSGYENVALPEKVTVRLYADGAEVASTEASEATNWAWSFGNLPAYEGGEKIVYTIYEDAVADFVPSVTGDAENGFVLTNTYDPKLGGLTITKTVKGDGADMKKAFTFTLTLTGMSGELSYTGAANGAFDASEPLTFTLAHGQSITVEGVIAGTQYEVDEAGYKNYKAAVTNGSGTITEGEAIKVDFVNTYEGDDDEVTIPKTGDTGNRAAMPVLAGLAIMWLGVVYYVIKRKLFA